MKLTVHQSGERHVGLTEERMRREAEEGLPLRPSRHFDVWHSAYEAAPGVNLEYLFRFRTDQLRILEIAERSANRIAFIDAAPDGEAVEVGLLIASPGYDIKLGSDFSLVGQGTLSNGQQIVLAYHNIATAAVSNLSEAGREISKTISEAGITPETVKNTQRIVIGFNSDGRRGWTEYAADTFVTPKPSA